MKWRHHAPAGWGSGRHSAGAEMQAVPNRRIHGCDGSRHPAPAAGLLGQSPTSLSGQSMYSGELVQCRSWQPSFRSVNEVGLESACSGLLVQQMLETSPCSHVECWQLLDCHHYWLICGACGRSSGYPVCHLLWLTPLPHGSLPCPALDQPPCLSPSRGDRHSTREAALQTNSSHSV